MPILALDGTRSIECESQYTLVYLLRRLDSANLDAGAVSLAAYDTANLNHGRWLRSTAQRHRIPMQPA